MQKEVGIFWRTKKGSGYRVLRAERTAVASSPFPIVLESHRLVYVQQVRSWAPGSLFF